MAEDLPEPPEPLAALVRGLEDRGFTTINDETHDAAFGNRLIELRSRTPRVGGAIRLVKDRSLWDVEIQLGDEWHGTYEVMLALTSAPYGTRAESHAERCATSLAVVDALSTAETSIAAIKPRLDGYRREYSKRLGIKTTE